MADVTDADLRGSRLWRVDLTGSRLHGAVLRDMRITDTWVDNVAISGSIRRLVVNEVDVTEYVAAELERRHPERQMLRATDPDGLRAAWAMIEEHARATVARARALPPAALHESVDDEYTFVQTLRHLVYATDRWITGPVFGEPVHPLGYPHHDAEGDEAAGLDVDATPSLDEVLALREERLARVAALLRDASPADLARPIASPNGGMTTVMGCVHVVLREEWAHDRYANRDLGLLEERAG